MFHPIRRASRLAVVAGAGAALAYFFDPQQGPDRRAAVKDRLGPLSQRLPSLDGIAGSATEGGASTEGHDPSAATAPSAPGGPSGPGLEQRVGNEWRPTVPEPTADHTLEDRVRSQVLGRSEFRPLGILVNDVDGVIDLRGEVGDDQVRSELVSAVRSVSGVRDVRDLTHRSGEPMA